MLLGKISYHPFTEWMQDMIQAGSILMSGDRSCSSLEDWNDRWDQWDDQYSDFEVRVNSWPKGDTPTGVSLITTHQ